MAAARPPPDMGARPSPGQARDRRGSDKGNGAEGTAKRLTPQRGAPALPIVVAVIPKGASAEARVTLDSYRDALVIDLRIYEAFSAANVLMPTKRGLTLALAKLPELAAALVEAERVAIELGLLVGD